MKDEWVPAPDQILPDEDQTGAEMLKITFGADHIKLCDYIFEIFPDRPGRRLPPLICNFYFSPKTAISGGKMPIPGPFDQKVLINVCAWGGKGG